MVNRWIGFTPAAAAAAAGARAIFGFPMRIGSSSLGALNLYRDLPGPLTDDQHADALVMAGVAARRGAGGRPLSSEGSSSCRRPEERDGGA